MSAAAAAAEEKTESAPPAAAPAPAGGSKLVMMLSAVNLLVCLAMVGVLFLSFQKEKKRPGVDDIMARTAEAPAAGGEHAKGEGKEGEGGKEGATQKPRHAADFGKMVALEQFTVNLTTPGAATPKYVRVNITLEVPTDDAESEVNSKMPQVRNSIIDLFNSKRPNDLATAEGRDYLKEEIRNALNTFLIAGKVKGVYFTSFALTS